MKKPFQILLIACLALIFSCKGTKQISHTTDDGIIEVIFLHVNDVYEIAPLEGGKTGGLARVATLRKQLLAENPNTLTVLAGDFLNPSLIATLPYNDNEKIRGRHIVDVMNHTGFDLVCFGNHEFDLTEKDLQKRLNESQFQWVSTDVFHKTEAGIFPFYKIKNGEKEYIPETWTWEVEDADGTKIKVGFFSACLDANPVEYVFYKNPFTEAELAYQKLKNETDIVLGLTHLDIRQDMELAALVPEVALIMGGHNHDNMKYDVDNVVITKADANAKTAYVHRIKFNTKTRKTEMNHTLVDINETIELDSAVTVVVEKWSELAARSFAEQGFDPNEVLTTLSEPLDGRESIVRNQQTNFGKMITRAMSEAFGDHNDCSIVNAGSIRLDDQLSGAITQLDIIRSLPFGGKILELKMTGQLLREVLNEGLARKGTGAYLQWDKIAFDDMQNAWVIGGEPLQMEREYTVIISDYLIKGIDIKSLHKESPGLIAINDLSDNNPENPVNDIRTAIVQHLKKR